MVSEVKYVDILGKHGARFQGDTETDPKVGDRQWKSGFHKIESARN